MNLNYDPSPRFPRGRGKCKLCGAPRYREGLCRNHLWEMRRNAYQRLSLEKTCRCGVVFMAHSRAHLYCGKKCCDKARLDRERKYALPADRECKNCAISFTPTRGLACYCSQDCSRKARSLRRYPAQARKRARMILEVCLWCRQEFTVPLRHYRRREPKFCSLKCCYASRKGKASPWFRGPNPASKSKNWAAIAFKVRSAYGMKCAQCGCINNGNQQLSVDHIVPRRMFSWTNCDPHELWNLIPLCRRCHVRKTLLEFYALQHLWPEYIEELHNIGYPVQRTRLAVFEFLANAKVFQGQSTRL